MTEGLPFPKSPEGERAKEKPEKGKPGREQQAVWVRFEVDGTPIIFLLTRSIDFDKG